MGSGDPLDTGGIASTSVAGAGAGAAGVDDESSGHTARITRSQPVNDSPGRATSSGQRALAEAKVIFAKLASTSRSLAAKAGPAVTRVRARIGPAWARFREKHADKFDAVDVWLSRFPIQNRAALLGIGAVLCFAVGFVVVVAASSPDTLMDRIEDGEAAQVLTELDAKPNKISDDEIVRGYALMALGKERDANAAWVRAGKLGARETVVEKAALASLDQDEAKDAESLLKTWPSPELDEKLVNIAEAGAWTARQRAYAVLRDRKALDKLDTEAFAIKNLEQGDTCTKRRESLDLVKKHGKLAALAAIQRANDRADNGCMKKALKSAEREIRAKLDAAQ